MSNIWPSIIFKPGHPVAGEALSDALAVGVEPTLEQLARDLKRENGVYRVEGHADAGECSARACEALSLRRARLVDRYLRDHGLPASLLRPPVGLGYTQTIPAELIHPGLTNSRVHVQQVEGPAASP